MTGVAVEPVSTPTTGAWPVTTATAQRAVEALTTLVLAGQGDWRGNITVEYSAGTVVWSVLLSRTGYPTLNASNGDWIVATSDGAYSVVKGADVNTRYKPTWDASTTPPVVTTQAGGQITVVCPAPDSADSHWVYSLTVTDNATAVDVTPSYSTDDGNVTLIATLTPGTEYVIAVTTTYAGLSATSVSTTVTAQE